MRAGAGTEAGTEAGAGAGNGAGLGAGTGAGMGAQAASPMRAERRTTAVVFRIAVFIMRSLMMDFFAGGVCG